jgi:hypothetical protein
MWVLIYSLSGFLALSLEILWFRLLGIMLKSNSLTFPHLLAVYLGSLALGMIAGSQFVRFGKRPAQTFLTLQSAVTIYAGLSVAVLVFGLNRWESLSWLRNYFGGYEPFDLAAARAAVENLISGAVSVLSMIRGPHPNFLSLYVLVPVALIAPPTFIMGMSFPFLQRVVQNNRSWVGRKVGWLQAGNIFGATAGAVLVGTSFLEWLGTTGTLRLLIVLGGTFIILRRIGVSQFGVKVRRTPYWGALAIVPLVIWSVPSRNVLWGALHGSATELVITAEDGSGLSLLKNERPEFHSATYVYTNGLGQSWLPYSHLSDIHSVLGILPIMLHKKPEEIAVIGLGSGDTLFSLGGREETKEITCIEIVRAELQSLRLLQLRSPYSGLESLLGDARIRYVFGDGRTYIGSNSKKYDVIEADALRPTSAFAGNLYSFEYFQLLKNRLKPGGLAVTWSPTERVTKTFLKVFPHVLISYPILIGAAEPIEFDRDAIRLRMDSPFTQAYYAKAGIDVKKIATPYFEQTIEGITPGRSGDEIVDFNSDLFPRDEYAR